MMFLLSVTVKIALLSLAALAAMAFLRRRSAALRHWVLATTLFGCVGIPALELFVPAWNNPPIVKYTPPLLSAVRSLMTPPLQSIGSPFCILSARIRRFGASCETLARRPRSTMNSSPFLFIDRAPPVCVSL